MEIGNACFLKNGTKNLLLITEIYKNRIKVKDLKENKNYIVLKENIQEILEN